MRRNLTLIFGMVAATFYLSTTPDLLGQVTIKEKLTITPRPKDAKTKIPLIGGGGGGGGVPCPVPVVAMVPHEDYWGNKVNGRDPDGIIWTYSGKFVGYDNPGIIYKIFGGIVSFRYWIDMGVDSLIPPDTMVYYIGASEGMHVWINDQEVLDYDFFANNQVLLDTTNQGIDITPYVHPDTNTFLVTLYNHDNCMAPGEQNALPYCAWISPLKIEALNVPWQLNVGAEPCYLRVGSADEALITADAMDQCYNQYALDDTMHVILTALTLTGDENNQFDPDHSYGIFVDLQGDTLLPVDSTTYGEIRLGHVGFIPNGEIPPKGITGIMINLDVRIDPEISGLCYVFVMNLRTTFCPPELSTGDTTDIILKLVGPNCDSAYSFRDEVAFSVSFANDSDQIFGNLMNPCTGELSSSLSCVPEGFKYVASPDTAPLDGHLIEFNIVPMGCANWCVPCQIPTGGAKAKSKSFSDSAPSVGPPSKDRRFTPTIIKKPKPHPRKITDIPSCGIISGKVKQTKPEILLGETKYYEAILCAESGTPKLTIVEVTPPYGTEPKVTPDAIHADVWGSSPVSWESGDKIGVYWEKKFPVWSRGTFVQMKDFSEGEYNLGLVRLIGRYFDATGNTKYKVNLTAIDPISGSRGAITIEVKKPATLGTSFNQAYTTSSFDSINIDDFIIRKAGATGIPPQFLKGQMEQESNLTDGFFWPTYRYEPWRDEDFRYHNKLEYVVAYEQSPFWVSGSGMDPNNVPSNDKNVLPITYPRSPKTIGNYVADNIGEYLRGGRPDTAAFFGGSEARSLTGCYNDAFIKYAGISIYNSTFESTKTAADNAMALEIRTFYDDWAQTRKAASYGYWQMLYTTAIGCGYPRSPQDQTDIPERLENQDILFPCIAEKLISSINTSLDASDFTDSTWQEGFEYGWREAFRVYHGDSPRVYGYSTAVFKKSMNFLPITQQARP